MYVLIALPRTAAPREGPGEEEKTIEDVKNGRQTEARLVVVQVVGGVQGLPKYPVWASWWKIENHRYKELHNAKYVSKRKLVMTHKRKPRCCQYDGSVQCPSIGHSSIR